MAGNIGYLKLFGYDFTFVLRHRFEKENEDNPIDNFTMWNKWELGFFFRRFQIVGKKNFHKTSEWKNNLVYEYMIGINLLWCKAWFTVQKGGMSIKL